MYVADGKGYELHEKEMSPLPGNPAPSLIIVEGFSLRVGIATPFHYFISLMGAFLAYGHVMRSLDMRIRQLPSNLFSPLLFCTFLGYRYILELTD